MSLEGKRVVIIGGASEIGFGTASLASEIGARGAEPIEADRELFSSKHFEPLRGDKVLALGRPRREARQEHAANR